MARGSVNKALNRNTEAILGLGTSIESLMKDKNLLKGQQELAKSLRMLSKQVTSGAEVYKDLIPLIKDQRKELKSYEAMGMKQADATDQNSKSTKENSKSINHSMRSLFMLDRTLNLLRKTLGDFFAVGENTSKVTASLNLSFSKTVDSSISRFENSMGGFIINMGENLDIFRIGLGKNSNELRKAAVRMKLTGQNSSELIDSIATMAALTGTSHEKMDQLTGQMFKTSLSFHRDASIITSTIQALAQSLPALEFIGLGEESTAAANKLTSLLGVKFTGQVAELIKITSKYTNSTVALAGYTKNFDIFKKLGSAVGVDNRAVALADFAVNISKVLDENMKKFGDKRIALLQVKSLFPDSNVLELASLGRALVQNGDYVRELTKATEESPDKQVQTFEKAYEEFKSTVLLPIMQAFPPLVNILSKMLVPLSFIAAGMAVMAAQKVWLNLGTSIISLGQTFKTVGATIMTGLASTRGMAGLLGGAIKFLPMITGVGAIATGLLFAVPAIVDLLSDGTSASRDSVGYNMATAANTKKTNDLLVKASIRPPENVNLISNIIDRTFDTIANRGTHNTMLINAIVDMGDKLEDLKYLEDINRKTKEPGTGIRGR